VQEVGERTFLGKQQSGSFERETSLRTRERGGRGCSFNGNSKEINEGKVIWLHLRRMVGGWTVGGFSRKRCEVGS